MENYSKRYYNEVAWWLAENFNELFVVMRTEMINLDLNGNLIVVNTVCDRKRIAFTEIYTP